MNSQAIRTEASALAPTRAARVPPALFLASLLCFCLPFVTVSCQGQRMMRLSGVQLAGGTTVTVPQPFGPPKPQKVEPNPMAALSVLTASGGLTFSLFKTRKTLLVSGISGSVSTIVLYGMKSMLDAPSISDPMPGLSFSYNPGFYLTLLLLLAAAVSAFLPRSYARVSPVRAFDGRGLQP